MVFSWHFTRGNLYGLVWTDVPTPAIPFSLLSEGHTGVALFITLSGYLFTKILDNRRVRFAPFIWSRFIRLAPMLTIIMFVVGVQYYVEGKDVLTYCYTLLKGFILPTWPNGGWSIAVELHFYLLLPLLLLLERKWAMWLPLLLLACILFKYYLFQETLDIRKLSYNTIVGRIDQFLLGMIAYRLRHVVTNNHILAGVVLASFLVFYQYFDRQGGHSGITPSVWIYLPAVEGFAYAVLICWYDNSFQHSTGRLSSWIALIGQCSYSIYLLHFFVVFKMFAFVNQHICELSTIYLNLFFALVCFLCMVPLAHLTFTYVEKPFLKYKINYS